MDDLYASLELTDRKATPSQIREAYYKLAHIYHPDAPEARLDPNSAEKFMRIKEAYSILADPAKRKDYDSRLASDHSIAQRAASATLKGGKGIIDLIDRISSYEPAGRVANKIADNLSLQESHMPSSEFFGFDSPKTKQNKSSPKKKAQSSEWNAAVKRLKQRYQAGEIDEKTFLATMKALDA